MSSDLIFFNGSPPVPMGDTMITRLFDSVLSIIQHDLTWCLYGPSCRPSAENSDIARSKDPNGT
ncbi:hypothetical protein BpHYR1_007477 [Brachionus plicatilis]|uniref:Uncharacterized protein n=1 Tax=Brachionus plicatilis TaxID=10195 RepID=A0A3M7Q5Z1_BRAPC|nr:hypothetical protein BpHYR1_007477 [Brachionus plicatilis]